MIAFMILSVVLAFASIIFTTSRWYWVFVISSICMMLLASAMILSAGETRVIDGDTVMVDDTRIRLKGLSCAELKTPLGQSQKLILITHFNSASRINCTLTGEKTYNREVGWCSLDDTDIGALMIETAGCQPCRRYDSDGRYSRFPITGAVPKYCKGK